MIDSIFESLFTPLSDEDYMKRREEIYRLLDQFFEDIDKLFKDDRVPHRALAGLFEYYEEKVYFDDVWYWRDVAWANPKYSRTISSTAGDSKQAAIEIYGEYKRWKAKQ